MTSTRSASRLAQTRAPKRATPPAAWCRWWRRWSGSSPRRPAARAAPPKEWSAPRRRAGSGMISLGMLQKRVFKLWLEVGPRADWPAGVPTRDLARPRGRQPQGRFTVHGPQHPRGTGRRSANHPRPLHPPSGRRARARSRPARRISRRARRRLNQARSAGSRSLLDSRPPCARCVAGSCWWISGPIAASISCERSPA